MTDRRARIIAAHSNPDRPPYPDAVPMTCTECRALIMWVSPPAPECRTVCRSCRSARTGFWPREADSSAEKGA